jgi:hypothetical protein
MNRTENDVQADIRDLKAALAAAIANGDGGEARKLTAKLAALRGEAPVERAVKNPGEKRPTSRKAARA